MSYEENKISDLIDKGLHEQELLYNSMLKKQFYCMKKCGNPDFSIEEWNKALLYCENAGIEGVERDKILSPELFPCETQCESCMNIVLDTQIKNRKLSKFNGL